MHWVRVRARILVAVAVARVRLRRTQVSLVVEGSDGSVLGAKAAASRVTVYKG